jgi:hypothetical protein
MHLRGSVKPEKPPCTSIEVTWRQDLQVRLRRMAREERTEAEMTIPGRRTRREMFVACREKVISTVGGGRGRGSTYTKLPKLHQPAPTFQLQLNLRNRLLTLLALLLTRCCRVQDIAGDVA